MDSSIFLSVMEIKKNLEDNQNNLDPVGPLDETGVVSTGLSVTETPD